MYKFKQSPSVCNSSLNSFSSFFFLPRFVRVPFSLSVRCLTEKLCVWLVARLTAKFSHRLHRHQGPFSACAAARFSVNLSICFFYLSLCSPNPNVSVQRRSLYIRNTNSFASPAPFFVPPFLAPRWSLAMQSHTFDASILFLVFLSLSFHLFLIFIFIINFGLFFSHLSPPLPIVFFLVRFVCFLFFTLQPQSRGFLSTRSRAFFPPSLIFLSLFLCRLPSLRTSPPWLGFCAQTYVFSYI